MSDVIDDFFSDEELLKSISELDNELVKGVKGYGGDDDSGTPEGDSESDDSSDESDESDSSMTADGDSETASPPPFAKKSVKKGLLGGKVVNQSKDGHGPVDEDAPKNEITHGGHKGNNMGKASLPAQNAAPGMVAPGSKKKELFRSQDEATSDDESSTGHGKGGLAKSFSDVASPEAERTLDVTPFLAAQAETLDSIAEGINALAKSLDGFGQQDALAKSVVDLGRGMIDTRNQIKELFESINDIRKGLRLPVRQAPKASLSKSVSAEQVERFEQSAPSLSKSQTAAIISDLVIKGDVDPMAVSAYEATGWMDRATEQAVQAAISARFARRA
jgi:hypothetical protein